MARQLKRWESPRQEGRNDKGKGGAARQRQRKKQMQMLRNRLKQQSNNQEKRGESSSPLFLYGLEHLRVSTDEDDLCCLILSNSVVSGYLSK